MRHIVILIAVAVAAIVGCSKQEWGHAVPTAPPPASAAPPQAAVAPVPEPTSEAKAKLPARRSSQEQAEARAARDGPGRMQAEVQRPAEATLPDFLWPPPAPSTQIVLPNSLFQASGKPTPSLSSMGAQLVGALEQARYFEYSYYRVPNGFALVARLERIGPDGTP